MRITAIFVQNILELRFLHVESFVMEGVGCKRNINTGTSKNIFWLRTLIHLRSVSRLQKESHRKKSVDNRRDGIGLAHDISVPADHDGDGKVDVAVYRNGVWFIRRSSDGMLTAAYRQGGIWDEPSPEAKKVAEFLDGPAAFSRR